MNEIDIVAAQEELLVFESFDEASAFALANKVRAKAESMGKSLTIIVRIGGHVVYLSAMPGTAPANEDWARRKANLAELIGKSSYRIGLENKQLDRPMQDMMGLDEKDYASHGGCFPIRVKGSGIVGNITVSGLPQREDHILVVDVIAEHLGIELGAAALTP